MIFWFRPLAEIELSEAVDYYEDIEPGLGYDFSIEVYSAIRRAMAYPKAWADLQGDIGVRWSADFHMEFYIPRKQMEFWL